MSRPVFCYTQSPQKSGENINGTDDETLSMPKSGEADFEMAVADGPSVMV